MAKKVEVLPWNYFQQKQKPVVKFVVKDQATATRIRKALYASAAVLAGVTFAFHIDPAYAATHADTAVATMATVDGAEIAAKLHTATAPIRKILMAFGHEIYFVMMLWGGIEVMIQKVQQGFARMKSATIAYIVLVWVPTIVDWVTNGVAPN